MLERWDLRCFLFLFLSVGVLLLWVEGERRDERVELWELDCWRLARQDVHTAYLDVMGVSWL